MEAGRGLAGPLLERVRPQGPTSGLRQELGKIGGGGSETPHGHPGDVPVQEIAGPWYAKGDMYCGPGCWNYDGGNELFDDGL